MRKFGFTLRISLYVAWMTHFAGPRYFNAAAPQYSDAIDLAPCFSSGFLLLLALASGHDRNVKPGLQAPPQ
jgi:hypothetical protein